MNLQSLSENYHVRRLEGNDVDLIYNLCLGNSIFYEYHLPLVTKESILADMAALPPGKNYDDKLYIGFFKEQKLIAVMDLILHYPEEKIAFIGFFMTDSSIQNKGIGSKIICETANCLKNWDFDEIRLGVDKGNPQSFAFWTKNGFSIQKEAHYILMAKKL